MKWNREHLRQVSENFWVHRSRLHACGSSRDGSSHICYQTRAITRRYGKFLSSYVYFCKETRTLPTVIYNSRKRGTPSSPWSSQLYYSTSTGHVDVGINYVVRSEKVILVINLFVELKCDNSLITKSSISSAVSLAKFELQQKRLFTDKSDISCRFWTWHRRRTMDCELPRGKNNLKPRFVVCRVVHSKRYTWTNGITCGEKRKVIFLSFLWNYIWLTLLLTEFGN